MRLTPIVATALLLIGCGTTTTRTVTTRTAAPTAGATACISVVKTGQRLCGAEGKGYCEGTRAALSALARYADPRSDARFPQAHAECLRLGVDLRP
jgi:hypothetical protein